MRAFALTILRCKIVLRHQLPDATNFFLPDERSYTGPHKHSQSARSLRVNTMLGRGNIHRQAVSLHGDERLADDGRAREVKPFAGQGNRTTMRMMQRFARVTTPLWTVFAAVAAVLQVRLVLQSSSGGPFQERSRMSIRNLPNTPLQPTAEKRGG